MTRMLSTFDDHALATALAFCDGVEHLIEASRALLAAGERVDLAGLDGGIGLLCAKALDLPPATGRALRPRLTGLLRSLDEMSLAIIGQNAS